ncbi:MAG: galactokinase [Myxococcota bacterium]
MGSRAEQSKAEVAAQPAVDPARVVRAFVDRFAKAPRLFSAPGRVNLIGEHTDYNDGFVLPMAIERRCYVAAAARTDRRVVVHSQNLDAEFEFSLDNPGPPQRGIWGDYIEGVAQALLARGVAVSGAELLVESEVSPGAGISASAALEISTGFALSALSGKPDPKLIALAGQAAEHEYVGTLCGIMDQYISALGESAHALLIDCRSLEPTRVPFELSNACLLVCDTRVKHQLASSEYNVRHAECRQAQQALAAVLPNVSALRDVGSEALQRNSHVLSPILLRRSRHVVTENERTLIAAAALRRGDLREMGRLMVDSHRSLRDDFEVSCPELDAAVDAALAVPGVFGARMTGGGFGGCTITLVEQRSLSEVMERIRMRLRTEFGSEPELFATSASDGAKEHAAVSLG